MLRQGTLFIFVLFTFSLFSQPTFLNYYQNDPARYDQTVHQAVQLPNGNVALTGTTALASGADDDMFVMLLEDNGTVIWEKTFGTSNADGGNAIAVTSEGYLVVGGYENRAPELGNHKLWKIDLQGNLVWEYVWGIGSFYDEIQTVEAIGNGGFLAGGVFFEDETTGLDAFYQEYESSGEVVRGDIFANQWVDEAPSFEYLMDGSYIFALSGESEFIRVDASGTQSTHTYSNAQSMRRIGKIFQASDGSVYFGGDNVGDAVLFKNDQNLAPVYQLFVGNSTDVIVEVLETNAGILAISEQNFVNEASIHEIGLTETQWNNEAFLGCECEAVTGFGRSNGGFELYSRISPLRTEKIQKAEYPSNSIDPLFTIEYGSDNVTSFEETFALCATSDNGYFVAGTLLEDPMGEGRISLRKIDQNGNSEWIKFFEAPSGIGQSLPKTFDISPSTDGHYFMNIYWPDSQGGLSYLQILKIDLQGEVVWTQNNEYESIIGFIMTGQPTANGGYAALVNANDGISFVPIILVYDQDGNVLLNKKVEEPRSPRLYDVLPIGNDIYYAGFMQNADFSKRVAIVGKVDALGNESPVTVVDSTAGFSRIFGLSNLGNNQIGISGFAFVDEFFQKSVGLLGVLDTDFNVSWVAQKDPHEGRDISTNWYYTNIPSNDGTGMVVSSINNYSLDNLQGIHTQSRTIGVEKYDFDGNVVWEVDLLEGSVPVSYDFVATQTGYAVVGMASLNEKQVSFLATISEDGQLVSVQEFPNQMADFKLYPNPTTDVMNIVFQKDFEEITAQLVDASGKILLSPTSYNTKKEDVLQLDLSDFQSGLYFLKLVDGKKVHTQPIIVTNN